MLPAQSSESIPALIHRQPRNGVDTNTVRMPDAMVIGHSAGLQLTPYGAMRCAYCALRVLVMLEMIRRLSAGLKIPADVLVRDYRLKRAA